MFESKTPQQTLEELDTQAEHGISAEKAAQLLAENGENVLEGQKPKTALQMFLAQLNEPMIYILFAAGAISAFLHEVTDAIIILLVILLNAIIGMVQEGKAQRALEALKKLSSPTAVVRRGGQLAEIPAAGLVVGDIVVLEAGRQVPADLRLLSASSLKIEEAALTGESVPVEKDAEFVAQGELPLGDRINLAYMSTNVSYGRGEGVVVATGMQTEIGRIAQLINQTENELTPLQKRLADLGKLLGRIAILLCVGLFVIALLQRRDVAEMLITAISLAVAAVPEGLPAIVTIVLALGVQRLVKVNTIVRRLPSVETLGAVSVVCSDKTGTLTQNKMTVVQSYFDGKMNERYQMEPHEGQTLLTGLMLCNDASIVGDTPLGDPTEIALLELAAGFGLYRPATEAQQPRIDELPFDSDRKMMTTLHKTEGDNISYTKGATDQVIERCTHLLENGQARPLTPEDKQKVLAAAQEMSAAALRVLALAMREGDEKAREEQLTFVGLVGMIDPPRPEAARAVEIFRQASVKTVMITGDHKDTALAIARQLGIAQELSQCMAGSELEALSEEQLARQIDDLSVFARVSPAHKVRIVQALRARGHIVSMTGDGVNDAPSLKAADIGVAMGITGTDVAKGAADMVLTDDNFATIEKAIEEGRGIYANIKKSVVFLLSSNFGEIITMFLAILVGLAAPLKAIHILWVNLITDSLPGLALGVDVNDTHDIMRQPPRNPNESLFAGGGLSLTLVYGVTIAAITLGAFLYPPIVQLRQAGQAIGLAGITQALANPTVLLQAQTFAFTVLGLSQLFHAVGMRNVERSVFRMNHASNKTMLLAFLVGFVLQIAVTEIDFLTQVFGTMRLSLQQWLGLMALSTLPLWVHEVVAPLRRKRAQV